MRLILVMCFLVFFFLTKIIELQIGLNRRCISGQYFIEFKAREVCFLGFSIISVSVWTMTFLCSSLESHKSYHTFDMIIQLFFLSLSFWTIFFCLLLMILLANKNKHSGSSQDCEYDFWLVQLCGEFLWARAGERKQT